MAREFFDYDPLTGATYWFDYDADTGKATIETTQDVQGALDYAKFSRDNGLRDGGIKENWFHYAEIPLVFLLKLRKMGIAWDDAKSINQAINTYWPFLKMTNKREGTKLATHFVMP